MSEICWESEIMEVLKIISSRYFHENHFEGIINPKFQLFIISGWRNIADFKMRKKEINISQTRIWICYTFLDFYATELKFYKLKNRLELLWWIKKTFWGVQILSCHLECVSFGLKFYRDLGAISQKMHF